MLHVGSVQTFLDSSLEVAAVLLQGGDVEAVSACELLGARGWFYGPQTLVGKGGCERVGEPRLCAAGSAPVDPWRRSAVPPHPANGWDRSHRYNEAAPGPRLPQGYEATIDTLADAFEPNLEYIIDKNTNIYHTTEMKIDINQDTLLEHDRVTMPFIRIDPRGGVLSQKTENDAGRY